MKAEPTAGAADPEATIEGRVRPEASAFGSQESLAAGPTATIEGRTRPEASAFGSQESRLSAAPGSSPNQESAGSRAEIANVGGVEVEWTQSGVERLWKLATSRLDDMTADLARQASHVEMLDEGKLRVYFPKNCTLTKTSCEKPERKSKLEGVLKSVAARHVLLEFAYDKRASIAKHVEAPAPSAGERKQRQRALKTHPFVQQCVELFDAEVMKVEEVRRAGND